MTDWHTAWRALLEGSDPRVARRLHQGHTYQRAGRVTDLRIEAGGASARVQGDRATPFSVDVSVPVLDDDAWRRVIDVLAGQVRHTARLLAGHAPESLDAELEAAGLRLLPRLDELTTTCDCHDDVWPCPHRAGLWEALAERFETDPFALLRMRGRGRERLLSELAAARRRAARGDVAPGLPLDQLDAAQWFTARAALDDLGFGRPSVAHAPAGTLRMLGDPPGWAGGVDAWKLFLPLVQGAADWVRRLDEP